MPLELSGVHEMAREEGTNRMILVRKNPYTRFVSSGNTPVIVQGGCFYSDGGDEYKKQNIPDWVFGALKQMSQDGLRNIGINPDTLGKPVKQKADVVLDEVAHTTPTVNDESDPIQPLNPLPSLDEQVRGALARLDSTEDTHWTKSGLPDLNAIREMLGRRVTRGKVEELMPDLTRPNFGD